MTDIRIPANGDYGPEVRRVEMVEEPAINARQGVTNQNVRYVLALSLCGVVILFALTYLLFFAG